ncbi:MAG: methionine--tRNA ligase [Bradyrhizobium sp.]|nr:methionine--tRNA ligase [Bradyrhizobium sp.]
MAAKTYYITTPIYYVNGPPHFAHAYTSVAADALARFARLDGREVHFLTGTDEHGQKVEQTARKAGVDPETFCNEISQQFRDMGTLMNISNDDFIRTTEPRHKRACIALWRKLQGNGDIFLGDFEGWYSVRDETFYEEDELINGKAPTGAPVEKIKEPNYFFRLSAYGPALLEHFEKNPDFIKPTSRRQEIINFVKSGLRDLSISRSTIRWGIEVPGDDEHVMYVWLDALTNYISALGYPDTDSELWRKFWPADVHLVGKDITRFHAVIWPAFLMAAGITVPATIFAHGWWTVEGQKMSKSLDNFIPPKVLTDRYGVDAVRYFMLRELSFGADGDFSDRAVVARCNGDLANGLGNLAQRVLTLVARRCGQRIPQPGRYTDVDRELLSVSTALLGEVRAEMEAQAPHRALETIWKVVAEANRYIVRQAPWSLPEAEADRLATILYVLTETIRNVAILVQPFIPTSASALLDQLAVPPDQRDLASFIARPLNPGQPVPEPVPLFGRLEERPARVTS